MACLLPGGNKPLPEPILTYHERCSVLFIWKQFHKKCSLIYMCSEIRILTHLPLVPHIYASVNWVIIGSGNGMSPVRRQAIIWTNAGLLSIELLGTSFSEIGIGILSFSCKKMHLKMSSAQEAAILSRRRWVKITFTSPRSKWVLCSYIHSFLWDVTLQLKHGYVITSNNIT